MCQTAKKAHVHLYYMYLRALLLTVRPTFTRAKPPIRKKKDHRLESVPKKSSHISKKVAIGSGMMTLLYCACRTTAPFFGKQARQNTSPWFGCSASSPFRVVIYAKRRSEAYACWRRPRRGSPLILDMIGSSCGGGHMLLRNLDRFFFLLNSETECQHPTEWLTFTRGQ